MTNQKPKFHAIVATFILIAITISACARKGTPLTAEQIRDKYSSGVVLVKNDYYYEINAGEYTIYVNSTDLDGFTFDSDSIMPNRIMSTGFLISSDGKVATNLETVSPQADEVGIILSLRNLSAHNLSAIEDSIAVLDDAIEQYTELFNRAPVDSEEESYYRGLKDEAKDARMKMKNQQDFYNTIAGNDIRIDVVSDLGVAIGDQTSGFGACAMVNRNLANGVAIVRLENALQSGRQIFDVTKAAPGSEDEPHDINGDPIDIDALPLNATLYTLAYDLDESNDNKPVVTTISGFVTEPSDDNDLQTNLSVSSYGNGAPILDEYGNLVGIIIFKGDNCDAVKAKAVRVLR